MDNIEIGKRINNIRLDLGMTMEDFGKIFNTSKGTVNNWEKGRNLPNKANLKVIAELGGVSVEKLLNPDSITQEELIKAKKIYDERYSEKFSRFNFNDDEIENILKEAILNTKQAEKNIEKIRNEKIDSRYYNGILSSQIEGAIERMLSEQISDNYTLFNYIFVRLDKLMDEVYLQDDYVIPDGTSVSWIKEDGFNLELLNMIQKEFEEFYSKLLDLMDNYPEVGKRKHLELHNYPKMSSEKINYRDIDDFKNQLLAIITLKDGFGFKDTSTIPLEDMEIAKEIIENSRDEIEEYYYKYLDNK